MVDIKCTFPKHKIRKQERASNSGNQDDDDESLLRQPIGTFCSGFREAKKAYENGTDEVRQLLIQECSLIYECNVCRNLFRNLANFICHKRKYCTGKTAEDFYNFPDRGSSMFIQTIERPEVCPVKSRSTDASPIPNEKPSNRDICKVIERLKRVEVSNDATYKKTISIDKEKKLPSLEPKVPDPSLESENFSTTSQGVYQTVKSCDEYSIKTELEEVNNHIDGESISPLLTSFTATNDGKEKVLASFLPNIFCEICKMQFETEKILKLHVEKSHTSTTYVFQCPTCAMTFLQPAAVIRHLANEHRKPLRRIRKLRDTILKKRVQIGDAQVNGMDRKVKRFQLNNTKDKYSSISIEQPNGRQFSSCSYCLKSFERRSALATHLTKCLARNAQQNKTDLSKSVNIPNSQKDENKIQNQILNEQLEHNNHNNTIFSAEMTVNIKQEPQEDENSTNIASSNTINKMFENLENQTFGNGLHTVCLENIEMMVEMNENSIAEHENPKERPSTNDNYCSNEINEKNFNGHDQNKPNMKGKSKRFRVVSTSKQLTCRCKICNKQFNALSNLRRHISMFHYRSKRFGCNLCDYRAFRRYDIVNHLTYIHKMTGERESMAVEYVTVHEIKYSKNDVEGDIVLINEETIANEHNKRNEQHLPLEKPQTFASEITLNSSEKQEQDKKEISKLNKKESADIKVKAQTKVIRKKFKKSLETQIEGKMRPIRNRIRTVNKDFVYDLLSVKEDSKLSPRITFKRSSTTNSEQNNLPKTEQTPPLVKIIPYRLRTEPLLPVDKTAARGVAENVCRNVVRDGLAAPSTLPELPTERPQMRSRLISASRSDSNIVPIIGSTELEAAGLKSTFFDDSFLEKFAKKSNPSFKMKPLLVMQHSPLNSILQKFDTSQQKNSKSTHNLIHKPPENNNIIPPNYSFCLLESIVLPGLKETNVSPNSKQLLESPSPPAAPKKRVTLMERLAENRAKRRDSVIRTALEN